METVVGFTCDVLFLLRHCERPAAAQSSPALSPTDGEAAEQGVSCSLCAVMGRTDSLLVCRHLVFLLRHRQRPARFSAPTAAVSSLALSPIDGEAAVQGVSSYCAL